jgi:DNA-binding transcriptional ArsR family regulator
MSYPPLAESGVGPNTTETEVTTDTDIEGLLGTLEDPDCRAIIEATSTEALSASELSEECDLPLSTTYRKLDKLTEVEVLEERVRLSRSGQHTSEYRLRIDQIELTVDPSTGITLSVSDTDPLQSDNSLTAGAD